MPNPILIKAKIAAGALTAGEMATREVVMNNADKALFYKDISGAVHEIARKGAVNALIAQSFSVTEKSQALANIGAVAGLFNQSINSQGPGYATDTYLVGSNILIDAPNTRIKAGTRYKIVFDVSKTAAGVVAPTITVRIGTNGSTADTARLAFVFLAQTAVADVGRFEINITFRSVGSGTLAVIQGVASVIHNLATTGLQTLAARVVQVTSAGFDSTISNTQIGVSVNAGTSAAWTVSLVQAELSNLN